MTAYAKVMEKEGFSPASPARPPRSTLAEEQRRAFEEDQGRAKRNKSLRWPAFLFRN
nr:hypothetical protein [uncultured Sphingomonas sp.]